MRKNQEVYALCNKLTKRTPAKVVLAPPPPIPEAEIPVWECEKWWEPAADVFTLETPFLAVDQKYLCSPSPIVETNENFYTGTPPPHDKFLTLQEMPLSCSFFLKLFGAWKDHSKL